jgi:DNA-binding PadR family transcriptional regulator
MYWYETVKPVDARSGCKRRWNDGTPYPTLHRLDSEGKIRGQWRDAPGASSGSRLRK